MSKHKNGVVTIRTRSHVLRGLLLLAATCALLSPSLPTAADQTTAATCTAGTTVPTADGPVCGMTVNGVTSWQGIRYASAPVGRLRWAPPQPPAPRTTTFPATVPGALCPQLGLSPSTTEDCLNLTVRAPADAQHARLPVLVQIHGGGFLFFGPTDASALVAFGKVISVEVNYRLGIFGFLANTAFGSHAGDYGLEDQQAALRWVRRNIAAFGGDPHNVTIYGASAGGSSVCDQTVSPAARGLFDKGISESGEYNSLLGVNTQWQPQDCKTTPPTEAQAQQAGARFAAAVGCGNPARQAACLRALPVSTLLKQAGQGLGPDSGTVAPIVNGTTLPTSPARAFQTGQVNDVRLMIGVARDEVQLPAADTDADYHRLVRQQFGPFAPAVFTRYPLARFPAPSAFLAYRTIIADSDAVRPALRNDYLLARRIPVYAYEMDSPDAPPLFFLDPTKPNGAYHVAEDTLLFAGPEAKLTPDQAALANQLKAQWAGFARTGNPTAPGSPVWLPFRVNAPTVMSLMSSGDSQLTSEIGQQHNCVFWNRVAAGGSARP